jgi:hypothetical protein
VRTHDQPAKNDNARDITIWTRLAAVMKTTHLHGLRDFKRVLRALRQRHCHRHTTVGKPTKHELG